MSSTPRTDDLLLGDFEFDDDVVVALTNFARELERENAALRMSRDNLQSFLDMSMVKLGKIVGVDDGDVPLTDWVLQGARNMRQRLEAAEKDAARYATARLMNPQQWKDAYALNISTGKPFDEIIDDLRPFYRTAAMQEK